MASVGIFASHLTYIITALHVGKLARVMTPVSLLKARVKYVDLLLKNQSLGWIINQEKSELKPTPVFVRGLQIPSGFSPSKTHSREMAQTSGFDPKTQVKTSLDCKMFDVANWVACLNRENGLGGRPSHEALSVSTQGALEMSSVAGQPPSLDRSHCSTLRLVAKSLKRDERCRPSSQRPQYQTLYRCLK